MNKKQLIAAWVIAIVIFVSPFIVGFYLLDKIMFSDLGFSVFLFFSIVMPILIIGSLLIYTLRDKKR